MIKKTLPQESKEAQIESSEAGIPPDQNGFHASLSSTVINSNRSIRLLAKDIGVNYQFLANAVNKNIQPVKYPARRILPLMLAAQRFDVLEYWTRSCGYLLVKAPVVKTEDNFFIVFCNLAGSVGKLGEKMRQYLREEDPGKRESLLSGLIDLCRQLTCSAAGLEVALEEKQKRGGKSGKNSGVAGS